MKKFIKNWLWNNFESSIGLTDEYNSFNRWFKSIIKKIASNLWWDIIWFKPNHFDTSWFIQVGDKYVYISISDVRHFKDSWYNNILFRTAEHSKDYTWWSNNSSTLEELERNVFRLFIN